MRVTEVTERDLWNKALLKLPYNHILQSHEWGQFKAKYGWKPLHLLFEEDGLVRAAASILRCRFLHLPLCIMYVPKGPALDYSDDALLKLVLATLEDIARRYHAIFIKDLSKNNFVFWPVFSQGKVRSYFWTAPKIDPDVCREDLSYPSAQAISTLEKRGWQLSSRQVQFRNTILINLTQEEDELLKAIKSKTRYNIRLAER